MHWFIQYLQEEPSAVYVPGAWGSCREYNPARRRRVSDAFVHNVPCAIANGKSKSRDAIITLWTSCSLFPILDMLYSSLRLYKLDVTYLESLSLFYSFIALTAVPRLLEPLWTVSKREGTPVTPLAFIHVPLMRLSDGRLFLMIACSYFSPSLPLCYL
jgi:hypothetical protein